MRIRILYPLGKDNAQINAVLEEYVSKLSRSMAVVFEPIKSKSAGRENNDEKKSFESAALLKKIEPKDFVVLLDEKGRSSNSSREFAADLRKALEDRGGKITFVIGGPYGVSDEIKKRANLKWRLSDLTMNHHLARLVLVEQIYRAATIWSNSPYHND